MKLSKVLFAVSLALVPLTTENEASAAWMTISAQSGRAYYSSQATCFESVDYGRVFHKAPFACATDSKFWSMWFENPISSGTINRRVWVHGVSGIGAPAVECAGAIVKADGTLKAGTGYVALPTTSGWRSIGWLDGIATEEGILTDCTLHPSGVPRGWISSVRLTTT
jgi:hypothetical protein